LPRKRRNIGLVWPNQLVHIQQINSAFFGSLMGKAFSEWWSESQPMRYVPTRIAAEAIGDSPFIRKPNTI
jgi:hypothetical protein